MSRFDPAFDLEISRFLNATPAQIWRCWSEPRLLEQWWAPRPVVTRDAVIELRPGGRLFTVMDVPDHGEMRGEGCVLEVMSERRITWTDLLEQDWHPSRGAPFGFVATITMQPEEAGTRYTARALHRTEEQAQQHIAMGFHDGWGTAISQLEALAKAQ